MISHTLRGIACAFIFGTALTGHPGYIHTVVADEPVTATDRTDSAVYEGLTDRDLNWVKAENWKALRGAYLNQKPEAIKARANFWIGYAHYRDGLKAKQRRAKWFGPARAHLEEHLKRYPTDYQAAVVLGELAVTWPSMHASYNALKYFPSDPKLNQQMAFAAVKSYLGYTAPPHRLMKKEQIKDYLETREDYRDESLYFLQRAQWLGMDDPELDRWLGRIYRDLGKVPQALHHYEIALESGPMYWRAELEYAQTLLMDDQIDAAQLQLQKVLGFLGGSNKGRSLACQAFGDTCMQEGYYDRAVQAYQAALDYDINTYGARHKMGDAALKAGDYRTALWAYNQVYKVDNKKGLGLFGIAKALHHLEKDERALAYIKAAMKEMSNDGKTLQLDADQEHYYGRVLWSLGEKEEALKRLTSAFDAQQSNQIYALWLYQCASSMGKLHTAINVAYLHGKRADPDRGIAAIEAIMKKWPRPRMEDFRAKRIPHTAWAHQQLARLKYQKGLHYDAMKHFRKARRDRGRTVWRQAAYNAIHAGETEYAVRIFKAYLSIQKDAEKIANANYSLAVGHAMNKDPENTLKALGLAGDVFNERYSRPLKIWAQKKLSETSNSNPPKEVGWLDQLGVVPSTFMGSKNGARILVILPDSPAAKMTDPLKPGDVILAINDQRVGYWKTWDRVNQQGLAEKTIELLIQRGELELILTLSTDELQAATLKSP